MIVLLKSVQSWISSRNPALIVHIFPGPVFFLAIHYCGSNVINASVLHTVVLTIFKGAHGCIYCLGRTPERDHMSGVGSHHWHAFYEGSQLTHLCAAFSCCWFNEEEVEVNDDHRQHNDASKRHNVRRADTIELVPNSIVVNWTLLWVMDSRISLKYWLRSLYIAHTSVFFIGGPSNSSTHFFACQICHSLNAHQLVGTALFRKCLGSCQVDC